MSTETTVPGCVSTSVSVKPHDIFKESSGQFPAAFVATQPAKPNHDLS